MTTNFQTLPMPSLAELSFSSSNGNLSLLTDDKLWESHGVRIAFTNRCGGVSKGQYSSLNLHHKDGDEITSEKQNRSILMSCFSKYIDSEKLICPNQVHGDKILIVDDASCEKRLAQIDADGVICSLPMTPVLLCFADCVPIIIVSPGSHVAVLHAGWRGAYADIAAKGLKMIADKSCSDICDCNIYIGPHIGPCCFEVSEELCKKFSDKYGIDIVKRKRNIDLSKVIIQQLLCAGANKLRITDSCICTACNVDKYYSYRVEGGNTGRHGAFAFIDKR